MATNLPEHMLHPLSRTSNKPLSCQHKTREQRAESGRKTGREGEGETLPSSSPCELTHIVNLTNHDENRERDLQQIYSESLRSVAKGLTKRTVFYRKNPKAFLSDRKYRSEQKFGKSFLTPKIIKIKDFTVSEYIGGVESSVGCNQAFYSVIIAC